MPGFFIMATIKKIYERVREANLPAVIDFSFTTVRDDFNKENKKQLFEGFNKQGGRLQAYASPDYAFHKYARNPIPGLGNPDLFDTGSFYRQIQTIISAGRIFTRSLDEKNDQLMAKYPGIFGLGGEYKIEFIKDKYRPAFMAQVRQKYKL